MGEILTLIRAAHDADGNLARQLRHGRRTWFDLDSCPGEASRWLTFHALRVLG